jgi:hypothetical protein
VKPALPVKIVRVTVEKMIERIIHISQPHHYYYGNQTDMYCVGVDDDDSRVFIATTCVLLILFLYILVVLLRKYEKENDKD